MSFLEPGRFQSKSYYFKKIKTFSDEMAITRYFITLKWGEINGTRKTVGHLVCKPNNIAHNLKKYAVTDCGLDKHSHRNKL